MHFLNQWGNRQHPKYDFATRELIYRDDRGNEVQRLSFPPRAERSEMHMPGLLTG
ncbi:MAG: hypothetical protein MUE59_01000 [Thiobacillaceae bacterium]|nr:hypothetical protein [Thiobacillaceae bacterium]